MGIFEPLGGGLGAGGGVARGRIEIDTSQLLSMTQVVEKSSASMEKNLNTIGTASDRMARAVTSSFGTVREAVSGALSRVADFSSALSVLGIGSSISVRKLDASFRLLSGSQQKATGYTRELRDMADDLNKPFLELKESATMFLPALQGSNVALKDILSVSERLRMKDPTAFLKDSVIAINELLSGESISLARRFEVPREIASEIANIAKTDQAAAIAALSDYLTSIGLTEDALQSMGKEGLNAFSVMRDEARQTAAVAFEPSATAALQIADAFGDVLRQVREINPELLKMAGTLATIMGTAALPGLAARIIPGASAVIPAGAAKTAGKLGLVGAAGYGAYEAGVFGLRQAGPERYQDMGQGEAAKAVWQEGTTAFKQILVIIADGVGDIAGALHTGSMYLENAWNVIKATFELGAATIGNAFATVVDALGSVVDAIVNGLGSVLVALDSIKIDLGTIDLGVKTVDLGVIDLGLGTGGVGKDLQSFVDNAKNAGDALRTSDEAMRGFYNTIDAGIALTDEQKARQDEVSDSIRQTVVRFGELLGVINKTPSTLDVLSESFKQLGLVARSLQTAPIGSGSIVEFTDDQLTAWVDFQDELAEVDAQAEEDRTEQAKRYADEQADAYEKLQERLASNSEQYQRELAQIGTDTTARVVASEQQRDDRIAELQENHQTQERQRLEDHQRDLVRMERDHRDTVLAAAARLDARAVLEEQRSYERKLSDSEENYRVEETRRAESLQKSIDQEMEAHETRLENGRNADAKAIAQLQERYQREQSEAQQAYNRQLADLAKSNNEKVNQINIQAEKERSAKEKAFMAEFNALVAHENMKLGIQRAGMAQTEADLRAWWSRMRLEAPGVQTAVDNTKKIASAGWNYLAGRVNNVLGGHQTGGAIRFTGAHWLEAGEQVIDRETARRLRTMVGGELSEPALVGMAAGGGGNRTTTSVGDIQINIYDATDPQRVGVQVREELAAILRSV